MAHGKPVLLALMAFMLLLAFAAWAGPAAAHDAGAGGTKCTLLLNITDFYGRPLAGALVNVYNASSPGRELLGTAVSNDTGWAELEVPNGSLCDVEVCWLDEEIPVSLIDNLTVNTNMTLGLRCWVCDMVVKASFEDGRPLMGGKIEIKGFFTSPLGNKSFSRTFSLNSSGLCTAKRMPMNCSYTVEGFRPGISKPFDSIELGRLNGTLTVNLTCPRITVLVSVVDRSLRPIEGATVRARDWGTGTWLDEGTTDDRGFVALRAYPGILELEVYKNNSLIGRVRRAVAENGTWLLLTCELQNFSLRVRVLDALGRPVAGAEVQLLWDGSLLASGRTGPDGTVIFTGLWEGGFTVLVLRDGVLLARVELELKGDTSLDVGLGGHIYVMNRLLSLSDLLTGVLAGATVLAILMAALLWPRARRRSEPS